MNKTIKLVSLLAPLALLLPAQAQDCGQGSCDGQERAQRTSTQDPKPDGKRQDQEGVRKRLLKKYDANGDGIKPNTEDFVYLYMGMRRGGRNYSHRACRR